MLTYRGGLPKKVKRARRQGRSLTARKSEIIREIVTRGFRLDLRLETDGLARSIYYYQVKRLGGLDKDKELKAEIKLFLLSAMSDEGSWFKCSNSL